MPQKKQKEKSTHSVLKRIKKFFFHGPKTREKLIEMLRSSESHNVISADVLSMIERLMQVSDMQVREVMVPKVQMIAVKNHLTFEELLPIVIESGHSRFPVIGENDNDIIGMILAKDLLAYSFSKESDTFNIKKIIRQAVFIPQSKRLNVLLREFRNNRNHMAIVLDEYSHVAGMVTIEDVLEQIVGEIEDEYDIDEEDTIKKLDDGTFIVKAETEIDEFNEYFHTHFTDEEYDTIGGIVMHEFGRMPNRGDKIKFSGLRFKILHSDNRRLYLLEVKELKSKE